jgi:predicted Rossmann-fold nucleotide-binding protein
LRINSLRAEPTPEAEDVARSEIRSICVYCGSGPGNDPAFAAAAASLGG